MWNTLKIKHNTFWVNVCVMLNRLKRLSVKGIKIAYLWLKKLKIWVIPYKIHVSKLFMLFTTFYIILLQHNTFYRWRVFWVFLMTTKWNVVQGVRVLLIPIINTRLVVIRYLSDQTPFSHTIFLHQRNYYLYQ